MFFLKPWLIFLIIWSVVFFCHAKVVMIQSTIRHADRFPGDADASKFYYPNDPNRNLSFWPGDQMDLTDIGKLNAYNLGKYYREKYIDAFPSKFTNSLVYFQTTKSSRTINTAQLIAAGLFRPNKFQTWNLNLPWLPIPIYTAPILNDTLFYALAFCENYANDRIRGEIEVERTLKMFNYVHDFRNYLTLNTGLNHTKSLQSWLLYHHFAAQKGMGIILEPWIDNIFPDGLLKDMSAIEYILQNYTKRMQRLLGGVWIKKFLNNTNEFINNTDKKKIGYFYVGNEIQVAAILNTIGIFEPHVPDYSSAVIFELHDVDNEYFVKMIYKNGKDVKELVVPGCEISLCSLTIFKDSVKNMTLENFEEDCGKRGFFPVLPE